MSIGWVLLLGVTTTSAVANLWLKLRACPALIMTESNICSGSVYSWVAPAVPRSTGLPLMDVAVGGRS